MSVGLNSAQKQRAVGAVVGMATGDALGAGYEGDSPRPGGPVEMIGGGYGPFAPGEWTDDTSMAIPILAELAAGNDLLELAVMDRVAQTWAHWAESAPDVRAHTRWVLENAPRPITAAGVRATANGRFAGGHNSAGNGTLMRTTPIALGYLEDPDGLTKAAWDYALMTHGDPAGAEACVLWNHAQRGAILRGSITFDEGLSQLEPERAQVWSEWIAEAEANPPEFFRNNGWVVHAFQEAWSAIHHTPAPDVSRGPEQFADALIRVVRAGGDTDTVAAIAGGLLGAKWGVSAIPSAWRRWLHGWPDRRTGQQLLWQAALAASGGQPDGQGWPTAERMDDYNNEPLIVQHPHDDGVWIGNMAGLDALPAHIDAVVSLCRVGTTQVPQRIKAADHIEIWLIDSASRSSNPNLEFALLDAARAVRDYRAEGKQVFLHCVQAHSRTPTVAAVYSALQFNQEPTAAFEEIERSLPYCAPQFGRVLAAWPWR